MKIELQEIAIEEIVGKYKNNNEEGVIGYNSKLNIRPAYQREFVYDNKKRDAVITSIQKKYPLNVMYWVKNENNMYEVLDGQQRTISICEYITGTYSIEYQYFHNLTKEEQDQILQYKLMIYICEGTDKEKLDWFRIINIAGEKLTDQELRNAIYTGMWLSDAKKYFSKTNCVAYQTGSKYIKGSPIRQEYLEKVIDWISKEKAIEQYMAEHQHNKNANELWLYFNRVIEWVKTVFSNYRKEMQQVQWGHLYNKYSDTNIDIHKFEEEISTLFQDEEVTNNKGIYWYIFTRDERYLNIRTFNDKQKRKAYEKQNKTCAICKKIFKFEEMEADHITPWHEGGKTILENCQMLCKEDNRRKAGK